ncbi:MAG: glycosyltransferase [Terriglobales bacterium]
MTVRTVLKKIYCSSAWHLGFARYWLRRMEREHLVSVLSLHHVSPIKNQYTEPLHPQELDDLLSFARNRMPILSLRELDSLNGSGAALVLSFDDGYRDFLEYAVPVLAKHRARVVQNVVPACLDSGRPIWNQQIYDFLAAAPDSLLREVELPTIGTLERHDRVKLAFYLSSTLKRMTSVQRRPVLEAFGIYMERLGDYPRTSVMSRAEVLEAARDHEIGAHSFDHDSMRFETEEHFRQDVQRCRDYFRDRLQLALNIYAFPNGSYRLSQVEYLQRNGMRHVLLTGEAQATSTDRGNRALPRITLRGSNAAEIKLRASGFRSRRRYGSESSSMRVLQVIPTIDNGGGAERELAYLIPELKRFGIVSEVAAVSPPYDLADELEANGCRVHRLNLRERDALRCIWSIAKLVRHGSFDVVHGHLSPVSLYVAATVALSPGPKRVISLHNLGYESYPADTPKRKFLKAVDAFLSQNHLHATIAVSNSVADHYSRHLRIPRPYVIPNFVPLKGADVAAMPRHEIADRFGVDPTSPLVVMLARFIQLKRHQDVVDASAMLASRNLRPAVLLVGGGPLAKATEEKIRQLGLASHVKIVPMLPHGLAMELLAAADIAVLPSTHEGFGIAVAEAMLLGRAVVTADAGGLAELVVDGETGLKVTPRDPAALASALERLILDSGLRERLGDRARQRVAEKVGMAAVLPKWVNFYYTLVTRDLPIDAAAALASEY